MKKILSKTLAVVALFAATMTIASCGEKNNGEVGNLDEQAAAIAAQFVDHTVAPTYTALAAKTEQLVEQLAALKANPNDAGIAAACNTFLEARAQWEMSEAFLFGAAGDFGIDPHIDSWPLDETAFNTLMNNPDMLALLDDEKGDEEAGELLSNALLGFHGLEYILFEEGNPKSASQISENQWVYVVAVAGDLRNRCYQLEVGWLGDDAPASHIQKLDDMEMQYTVAGGDFSYGENMKNAGLAGSTYRTCVAAIVAIVQGSIDIADEVGTSKIYSAYQGGDPTYIESPYSYMSITDFHNNIVSIRNSYMGGVEGQRDESKSLHRLMQSLDSDLDGRVIAAIDNAIAKIDAMPAPFALHYTEAANGDAVEACSALSSTLDEVIEVINNNN